MVSKTTTETVLTASILNELNWNTQETIGFDAWHKNAPFLGTELNSTTVANIGWNTKSTITLEDWDNFAPNVETINSNAFANLQLNSIVIPNLIKEIANSDFMNSSLKDITFEDNSKLTIINDHVFQNTEIKSIIIPFSVKTLRGTKIFSNTPNLTKIKMNQEFNYSSGSPRYGLTQTQWNGFIHNLRLHCWTM